MGNRRGNYGVHEMRDFAKVDTSEKPDACKLFCEAFGAAMMAALFIGFLFVGAV
jgi:hypothetical protein